MTTEDDFQQQLDANPEYHQTRLVFADWLQERGDPRAEGSRVMGKRRFATKSAQDCRWYDAEKYVEEAFGDNLPHAWYVALVARLGTPRQQSALGCCVSNGYWLLFSTRRAAEDAAALAFLKLTEERRARLLAQAG